jgi:phosphoribosylaminoimidazole-succinocarboxamide synthase
MTALHQSNLKHLSLMSRGKVRDIYDIDDKHLLIVATDRLSAFDVVLPQPIPGKGEVLTRVSNFWFSRTKAWVANHLTDIPVNDIVTDPDERALLGERAVVVRRLKPLPIEAVVRGYLAGTGWKDYQCCGSVCGVALPVGLRQADRLDGPIFTPATKAVGGQHDENIDFAQVEALVGPELAASVRALSVAIYRDCADYARRRGIIIADTKLEFGLDEVGRLHLIDEVLTPDSSRFWPADRYRPGVNPPSFDKQFVRDYLETLDWNKTPPGPLLPAAIIAGTAARYAEAEARLTGRDSGKTHS